MINIHLGLSYACNMNCSHCYVKEKASENISFQPEQFEPFFNKLEELGSFYITYTMGENILYKHFNSFAREASKRGFYQILLSNGSVISSPEKVSELADLGIKKIGISLDSANPEKHDSNRHYTGAFEKAVNAIKLILENAMISVQILHTISEDNIDGIIDVLELGKQIGVTDFSFLWMRTNGKLSPVTDYDRYKAVMQKLIIERQETQIKINIHDIRLNPILQEMYEKGMITESIYKEFLDMNVCHAFDELLLIDPSGDIYMCNFLQKPFANIFTTGTEELLRYRPNSNYFCS